MVVATTIERLAYLPGKEEKSQSFVLAVHYWQAYIQI